MYLFDLKNNKLKRVKIPFDEFRIAPSFSPVDNNRLVCVGMQNGFNDLYIIDRARTASSSASRTLRKTRARPRIQQ